MLKMPAGVASIIVHWAVIDANLEGLRGLLFPCSTVLSLFLEVESLQAWKKTTSYGLAGNKFP